MEFNIIYFLVLHSALSIELPKDFNSGININNDQFSISNIYNVGNGYPTDAHFDVYGNLFFVKSGREEKGCFFNIHVIKHQSTVVEKIEGLPEGLSYSIAVDKKNAKVYFGTAQGIFMYSYETHKATPILTDEFKLDMIFIDNNSNKYITEHHNGIEELFRLDSEKKIRMNNIQALNELAIDNENNFYYILGQQICILKKGEVKKSCFGKIAYNGIAQIAIHNETVFIASHFLTYFQVNNKEDINQVNNLPGNVTAIAFENTGDFILGINGKIFKYKLEYNLSIES